MSRTPKSVLVPLVTLLLVVGVGLVAFGPLGIGRSTVVQRGSAATGGDITGRVAQPVGSVLPPLQAGWVKAENAKPGTTDWHLANASRNGAIEGYADAVSAQSGDKVTLYVSTKASYYSVRAFRMGYYGGAGARLVWTAPGQLGAVQSPPVVTRRINMVEAVWHPSLTVAIDTSWVPGDYLFRLVGSNGYDSYIPLTVRDDTSTSALLLNNSVTTWQAYNLWGGASLYSGRNGRADIVSFDRPYTIGDGSGDFLGNEFPMVSLVESLGLDVSYATDVDLHERPQLLLNHHAFVSLGHDEYWSTAMRDGVEVARDHGVNLAFFGANSVYRHIRLAASPLGSDRREINYRSLADPLAGVDNAEVTVSWRERPVSRPESSLLGELYQCNPVRANFIVTDPSAWVYAGANVHAGTKIVDLIGSEYDAFVPGMPGPRNVEIMAHSPLRCRGKAGYSDFTYYAAPSGAGVIDTGTNNWVPLLTNPWSQPALIQITETILSAFALGPAGTAHPSASNFRTLPRGTFPASGGLLPSDEGAPVTSRPTFTSRPTSTTEPRTSTSSPPADSTTGSSTTTAPNSASSVPGGTSPSSTNPKSPPTT